MQQDARPAGTQHHSHGPGRRRNRFQIRLGRPNGLLGQPLAPAGGEEAQVLAPAAPGVASLPATVLHQNHRQVHAHQRAGVGSQNSVGSHHQPDVVAGRQAGADFLHPVVHAPRRQIRPLQQGDFVPFSQTGDGVLRPVSRRSGHWPQSAPATLPASPDDGSGRFHGTLQPGPAYVFGVGEAGLLAAQGADAQTPVQGEAAFLHPAFLQGPALGAAMLKENLAQIDGAPAQPTQQGFRLLQGDLRRRQELRCGLLQDPAQSPPSSAAPEAPPEMPSGSS